MTTIVHAAVDAEGRERATLDARRRTAYRRATAHSRAVRVLRLCGPAVAAALVVATIAQLAGNPFAAQVAPPQAADFGLNGSRITMQTPVLQGFKRDGKPYRLDAETAEQDIRAPHVVELKALDALMGQGGDGWVRMKTKSGVFDNRKETLQLPSLVNLLTDGGYDVRLDSADVELKSGVVRSGGPVDVLSPDGTMKSERLEVRNNGKELVFTGRVKTVLHAERPARPAEPKKDK